MQCAVRFFSFSAREGQTVAANGANRTEKGADVARNLEVGHCP
jgi:hypothetical protein